MFYLHLRTWICVLATSQDMELCSTYLSGHGSVFYLPLRTWICVLPTSQDMDLYRHPSGNTGSSRESIASVYESAHDYNLAGLIRSEKIQKTTLT